jgi:hypothetical protein
VLYQGSDDACGRFAEVYDDAKPASLVEVASVVPLAARGRVVLVVIWTGDDAEHKLDLIGQQRSTELEMQPCSSIEDDQSPIGIQDAGLVVGHSRHATAAGPEFLPAIASTLRRLCNERRATGTAPAR